MRLAMWKVSGLVIHVTDIASTLFNHEPHLLILQEARETSNAVPALRARCRALGYTLHHDPTCNLLAIWRRGLKVAPIRTPGGEDHRRSQLVKEGTPRTFP